MTNPLLEQAKKTRRAEFKTHVGLLASGAIGMAIEFDKEVFSLEFTPDEARQLAGMLLQGASVAEMPREGAKAS